MTPDRPNVSDPDISSEPLNILFNPGLAAKKSVWDIDLLEILDVLSRILEKNGARDLRMAGIAALSSALIYKMKVDSIFAMQKDAMEKKPLPKKRTSVDIQTISMPYRHQSTYAVSMDDLLELLQSLVVSIANPRSRRSRLNLEPSPVPDIKTHLISLESVIEGYKDLILRKIQDAGRGSLDDIVSGLDPLDSIRCFIAALFLARDGAVTLEQDGEDIAVVVPQDAAERGSATDA